MEQLAPASLSSPAKLNGQKTGRFEKQPKPWMYTPIGGALAMALIKLSPIHRDLMELEIQNLQDYFYSDWVHPSRKQKLTRWVAFWWAYGAAVYRIFCLSPKARQDYYALNRQGSFASEDIASTETMEPRASKHLPLLIVPGLNTPPVFFREMAQFFICQGYNVAVASLPQQGMATVAQCSQALKEQIEALRERCGVEQINVVGHCLGGLIAKHLLENWEQATEGTDASTALPIKTLVALGTGFLGAAGVEKLKNLWIPRHPDRPVPAIFDELIDWNINIVRRSAGVAYHSVLTVWDFMVHFPKGFLQAADSPGQLAGNMASVSNHLIDDPAIDHLTLALNPKVFASVEKLLLAEVAA